MSLADAEEFIRQATALQWCPRIMIIGGEPTLNNNFRGFVALAANFAGPKRVEIWSNGFGDRAQRELVWARESGLGVVQEGTIKKHDVVHRVKDIFIAPVDYGQTREPCGSHSCISDPDCGISVDASGYTLCCMGGAIDGILGLGARTKRLADLFDPVFAEQQTRKLCAHCGQHLGLGTSKDTQLVCKTRMSQTWHTAALKCLNESKKT
jgi:sulfatase maturation enzyme AslB (radical SAM superfamily)